MLNKQSEPGQVEFLRKQWDRLVLICTPVSELTLVQDVFRYVGVKLEFDFNGYMNQLRLLQTMYVKQKNEYLLWFIKSHKINPVLQYANWSKSAEYVYFRVFKILLDPAERFVLDKIGLNREYITKDQFINNYPVIEKMVQGKHDIYTHPAAVVDQIQRLWPENTKHKYVLNPVQPALSVDNVTESNSIIVEWDLVSHGLNYNTLVYSEDDGDYYVPDQKNPLTQRLMPFDLTVCSNKFGLTKDKYRIVKPTKKIDIDTAVRLVESGVPYYGKYRPLDLFHRLNLAQTGKDKFPSYAESESRFAKHVFVDGMQHLVQTYGLRRKHACRSIVRLKQTRYTELKRLTRDVHKSELVQLYDFPDKFIPSTVLDKFMIDAYTGSATYDESVNKLNDALTRYIQTSGIESSGTAWFDLKVYYETEYEPLIIAIVDMRKKQLQQSIAMIKKKSAGYDIDGLKHNLYGTIILRHLDLYYRRYVIQSDYDQIIKLAAGFVDLQLDSGIDTDVAIFNPQPDLF
jgi:hypothetical protein